MRQDALPLAVAALTGSLALSMVATAAPVGAITASDAWSRPVAPGLSTGVAYVTLHNGGATPDRLRGAASPVAASVGLHQSMDMGGMMSMRPMAQGLALPPGAAVPLAPGGYHLMLEGLKHGLQAGTRYPLTLRFAHAKPLTVEVQVRPNGG
jgi:copper(I)-binding protein